MKDIKIYTTPICPFCVQAKRLLEQLKLPFEDIDLSRDHDLRMKLSAENGGWRTVPMIFIGEEFVGGFQELSTIHRNGELMKKVGSE